MLPCILEGLPSQESEVSMACPPALDELLGRSSQSCKVQHMTNGDSAAHLSAKVAAVWPQSLFIPHFRLPSSDGSLKGSADVPKGSSASPKGSATSVIGSSSSVKGTTPNGKPPVSPTSKSASARSDVASHHCCCSDNQSHIRSQHFPPSQYFAGITAQSSCTSASFSTPYSLSLLLSDNLASSLSPSTCLLPLGSVILLLCMLSVTVLLFLALQGPVIDLGLIYHH